MTGAAREAALTPLVTGERSILSLHYCVILLCMFSFSSAHFFQVSATSPAGVHDSFFFYIFFFFSFFLFSFFSLD